MYLINPLSGTGKTWLAKVLREYNTYGEAVNSYTYSDYVQGLSLERVLTAPNTRLVVIDRYDLLPDELSSFIDATTDKIILLDCKHGYCGKRRAYFCNLRIEETKFTVKM